MYLLLCRKKNCGVSIYLWILHYRQIPTVNQTVAYIYRFQRAELAAAHSRKGGIWCGSQPLDPTHFVGEFAVLHTGHCIVKSL